MLNAVLSLVLLTALGADDKKADDSIAAVEAKITERMHKLDTLRAKVTTVMSISNPAMEMRQTTEGTMEMKVSKDHQSMRSEQTSTSVTKVAGQETKSESKTVMVTKDREVLTLSDANGQKTATKMKSPTDTVPETKAFEYLGATFDLKLAADEKVSGRTCWVIEATPKQADGITGKSKYWYDQDTGFMVKMESMSADGKPMTTMTYSEIEVGVTIDDARFEMTVPEGYQVSDLTGG